MEQPVIEIHVKDFAGFEFKPREVLLIGGEAWEILFGKQGTPVRLVNQHGEKSKLFYARQMKMIQNDRPR